MNATQFAWLYLIENGTCRRDNNGFGYQEHERYARMVKKHPELVKIHEFSLFGKIQRKYLDEIKEVGVDWKLTSQPYNDNRSVFGDTYGGESTEEFLGGELFLKNGEKQYWEASKISVSNVSLFAFASMLQLTRILTAHSTEDGDQAEGCLNGLFRRLTVSLPSIR